MSDLDKIKIKMFGKHLCNIKKTLMRDFDTTCRVVNFSSWIRSQAFRDFKLNLSNTDDLIEFNEILEDNHYENIADWLRETMRNEIKDIKNRKNNYNRRK